MSRTKSQARNLARLAGAEVTDLQGRTYTIDSVDYEEAEAQRPAGWFAKLTGGPFGQTWEPLGNLLHYTIEPHLMAHVVAVMRSVSTGDHMKTPHTWDESR